MYVACKGDKGCVYFTLLDLGYNVRCQTEKPESSKVEYGLFTNPSRFSNSCSVSILFGFCNIHFFFSDSFFQLFVFLFEMLAKVSLD